MLAKISPSTSAGGINESYLVRTEAPKHVL